MNSFLLNSISSKVVLLSGVLIAFPVNTVWLHRYYILANAKLRTID